MHVKPNKTTVEAKVVSVTPQADGFGAEAVLHVAKNLTESPESDFIRPKPDDKLTVFSAKAATLEKGGRYRVRLRLNAGPTGSRVVVEGAEAL